MYIQEVVLEGFKTYMHRTVISNFDEQFNAITGYNGSGKSNILDAIQFVLGSASKQMLRLKNGLTELIYKEGYSGITKASVSIKFKCVDKNLRPVGYEQSDELIVTRIISNDKNTKYFVNGYASNLTKVKNLFRSVHLNIQNPHFLVKQGQITKIMNLKPPQLLGMLEETAGTAFYNKTKYDSQRILQKKDLKLRAIQEILLSSIEPQVQKMSAQRIRYYYLLLRYAALKEQEILSKNILSQIKIYQYHNKLIIIKRKDNQLMTLINKLIFFEQTLKRDKQQQKIIQAQLKQINITTTKNTHYKQLKTLLLEKQAQKTQIKSRIMVGMKRIVQIKEEVNEKQQNVEKRKKDITFLEHMNITCEKQKEQIQSVLLQNQNNNNNNNVGNLIKQEQENIVRLTEEIDIYNKKIKQTKQLMLSQPQKQQGSIEIISQIEALSKQIQTLKEIKAPRQIIDPQMTELQTIQAARKKLLSQYYQLNFYYKENVVEASKVYGKLYSLFTSKDQIYERALEIGAGQKLQNVVVENEKISKILLQNDAFGRNVTIIPNNRITFKSIKEQIIVQCEKIAAEQKGLAKAAYLLIDFDAKVQNSIMFAFSNFIVCSTPAIAKAIAFTLGTKCVTYEGDIFQYGTLTGGTSPNIVPILPLYTKLKHLDLTYLKQKDLFTQQKHHYEAYLRQLAQYKDQVKELELLQNKKEKLTHRLLTNTLKPKDYSLELDELNKHLQYIVRDKQEIDKKIKELKKCTNKQEEKAKLIEQKHKHDEKYRENIRKITHNQLQIQHNKNHIQHIQDEREKLQKELIELQKKEQEINSAVRQYQIQVQIAEEEKKKIQRQVAASQNKMKVLLSQHQQLIKHIKQIQEQKVKIQSNSNTLKKQVSQMRDIIKSLLNESRWLQQSAQPDKSFNYQAAIKEYELSHGEIDKLQKSAKTNIDEGSFKKMMEQYESLLSKRKTLEHDKLTLLSNMHELDEKRIKTLQKCFESVKNNLSKIFSDLLPGARAFLNPVDTNDITKGIEIKIQFNRVLKELSELSGGQRSLLALSFILALLLYKPSPFYILDQIDSALDQSHTENIGYMISQRFPQSQFIIISLKEGMFQNANVLYKVHYVDGQSKVQWKGQRKK